MQSRSNIAGIVGNPDFYPLRAHPDLLEKYAPFDFRDRLSFLMDAVRGWTAASMRLVRSLLCAKHSSAWERLFSVETDNPVVVVSHGGGSVSPAGPLEAVSIELEKHASVFNLLVDGEITLSEDCRESIGERIFARVPSRLRVRVELNMFWQAVKAATVLIADSMRAERGLARRVLLRGAATSYKSIYSQRVAESIGIACRELQATTLLSVFEGHPHERLAFRVCQESVEGVTVAGYVQSGVYPDPFLVTQQQGHGYDPDLLCLTGRTPRAMLEGRARMRDLSVLGSGRKLPLVTRRTMRNRCLLLPDAFPGELAILLNFADRLLTESTDIEIIARLHPRQESNRQLVRMLQELAGSPRFELSSGPLVEDLSQSRIALYRGSTTAIIAAAAGLPVGFVGNESDRLHDPMFGMTEEVPSVISIDGVRSLLDKDHPSTTVQVLAREYFGSVDSDAVRALVTPR